MPTIVLRDIRFSGYCGVTENERHRSQWISIDLDLVCSTQRALTSDDLADTVDYARVVSRVQEVGTRRPVHLLEALAHEISEALLSEFPIASLRILVKKVAPPIPNVHGSVGIRLSRAQHVPERRFASTAQTEGPAPFLAEQHHRLPKGLILDLAAGFGRNALYLAQQGYSVVAIDRDPEALAHIEHIAQSHHWPITVQHRDLELQPTVDPQSFGTDVFDGIIVFFYLYRPLFPALLTALKPGGVLVYETFLIDNHIVRQHPRRKEFCLEHNELLSLTQGLRILHYDEGEHETGSDHRTAFTARLVAQKPSPRLAASTS